MLICERLWLWEDLDPTMHLACSSLNMRPILSTAHRIKYLHLSTHPHINITTPIFFFFCFLYGKLFSCYLTNKTHSQDKHHIHLCSRGKLTRKIEDKTLDSKFKNFMPMTKTPRSTVFIGIEPSQYAST